jgi:RNA recognition motif-containing protein
MDGGYSSDEAPKRLSRRDGHAKRPDLWHGVQHRSSREEEDFTTLVLKNMPSGTNRDDLCRMLDAKGFACGYNFLYVPMNFKAMKNFCYAFANFVDHATAERARSLLHGYTWTGQDALSPLEATWSRPHQGLQVHIERFRNSPVMHACVPDKYKPLMLSNGKRVSFPDPTKTIVAPRELRRQSRSTNQDDTQ